MSRKLLEAQIDPRAERIIFSNKEVGDTSIDLLLYIQFLLEIRGTQLSGVTFQELANSHFDPTKTKRGPEALERFIQSVREDRKADLRLGVHANISHPNDAIQTSAINTFFTDKDGRVKAIGYQVLPPRVDQWLLFRAGQFIKNVRKS